MNILKTVMVMLVLSLGGMASTVYAEAQSKAMEQTAAAININSASAAELQSLNGVGAKKAEAIVAYRTEFGPFKSAEELAEVKGIGQGIVQRNADRIIVK